jgi:hypothetical protein
MLITRAIVALYLLPWERTFVFSKMEHANISAITLVYSADPSPPSSPFYHPLNPDDFVPLGELNSDLEQDPINQTDKKPKNSDVLSEESLSPEQKGNQMLQQFQPAGQHFFFCIYSHC